MNPHDDQYYSPGFDAGASFQMNPLSSHPPRTPKSSVVSRPTTLYNPGYEPSEEQVEEHITAEDLELDEEDERVKQAEKRVLQEEVWKEIILTANGRDKVFVRIRPMENVTVRSPLSVSTESHTIFNSPLSPVPLLCFWDSIDKGAEEEQLELQPCRTAHLHSRWSLADSVCIMQSSLCLNSPHSAPDTHLCAIGVCFCCSTGCILSLSSEPNKLPRSLRVILSLRRIRRVNPSSRLPFIHRHRSSSNSLLQVRTTSARWQDLASLGRRRDPEPTSLLIGVSFSPRSSVWLRMASSGR